MSFLSSERGVCRDSLNHPGCLCSALSYCARLSFQTFLQLRLWLGLQLILHSLICKIVYCKPVIQNRKLCATELPFKTEDSVLYKSMLPSLTAFPPCSAGAALFNYRVSTRCKYYTIALQIESDGLCLSISSSRWRETPISIAALTMTGSSMGFLDARHRRWG